MFELKVAEDSPLHQILKTIYDVLLRVSSASKDVVVYKIQTVGHIPCKFKEGKYLGILFRARKLFFLL
jgi:hypothetical protein